MQFPTDHRLPGLMLFLVAVGVLLLLAAVVAWMRGARPWLQRIQHKPLMTENELAFFRLLQRALPGHHVFPQVSFAAFVTDDGQLERRKRWAVRARFDRKIADFIICTRETLDVVAIVELDDRTHSASADRQRDDITKAAGYRTIRFQSKQKPSEAEIAALFVQSTALAARKLPEKPLRARR